MSVCQYYPKGNTQGGYRRNVMPLAQLDNTVLPGDTEPDSTDLDVRPVNIKPESQFDSQDLGDTEPVVKPDSGASGGKEGFHGLSGGAGGNTGPVAKPDSVASGEPVVKPDSGDAGGKEGFRDLAVDEVQDLYKHFRYIVSELIMSVGGTVTMFHVTKIN